MKRPRQHQIGDIGEQRTAHAFVQYGWIVQKLHSDYGFDFLLQRVDKEMVTGDFALLQVKATEAAIRPETENPSSLLHAKHKRLWKSTLIPIFLILVDLRDDRLFIAGSDMRGLDGGNDGMEKRLQHVRPDQFMLLTDESASQLTTDVAKYWAKLKDLIFSDSLNRFTLGIGDVPWYASILWLNSKLVEILGYELADSVTMDVIRSLASPKIWRRPA